MAQCKKCGKKGLFLKVNDNQLCENCAREERNYELKIRQLANESAQFIHRTTDSIYDTVNTIISIHESGGYPKETAEEAMQILNEALAETKRAIAVVKDPDISKIGPTIEAATKRIEELHAKSLDLLKLKVD